MMQAPEFGVDLAAPPRDLAAAVQSLATLCTALNPSLLVAPLAHPRYRRDYKRARTEPMTRSDRVLSSTQWGRHVVGKVSPWLQLDSPHEAIRRRSEEAFKSEIAWAAHLGLQAVLLPPPPPGSANYARLLQWACLSTQHMRFFVRVSIASPREGDGGGGGGSSAADPWRCWDELRTLCEQHSSLAVALELGIELPDAQAELDRWCGEPLGLLLLPTSSFVANKKGYPTLPRRHQAAFAQLLGMMPKVVVSGREDGRRSERADERMSEGFSAEAAREGLGAYLQYLGFVISRMPPPSSLARLEAPYYDYLQAPLQPLADNLESSTYETFEQDPVKYKQYQAAVRQALIERHPADGPVPVVMVLGAGRGPLVDAALYAAVEAGRTIRVFALDKNANAVVTLQNRRLNEPTWAAHVTVVTADMRSWAPPELADMIVSELLGSWGDNELSPECLDGAMRYLKPSGISIPSGYVSTVAPLSSSKLWNEVGRLREVKHFETPYVVKVHNAFQMASAQRCFTFEHPAPEQRLTPPAEPDNTRARALTFDVCVGGRLHGFVGYFHCTLYKDVAISTDPATESIGMFSWFPLYLPLRQPVHVPDGGTVTVQFWRHVSPQKVWYEWALLHPEMSPIHNPNGRSYHIGLL